MKHSKFFILVNNSSIFYNTCSLAWSPHLSSCPNPREAYVCNELRVKDYKSNSVCGKHGVFRLNKPLGFFFFCPHLTIWTIGTFSCYVIILQGRLVLRISANSIHHSNTNTRHSRCSNISVDVKGDTNQVGDSVIPPLELRYICLCFS